MNDDELLLYLFIFIWIGDTFINFCKENQEDRSLEMK